MRPGRRADVSAATRDVDIGYFDVSAANMEVDAVYFDVSAVYLNGSATTVAFA
jgi:hypothetical protein